MLLKVRASSPISSWRFMSMLCSRSPVLPICCATFISLESGLVMDLEVRKAIPTPRASATSVLKMAMATVAVEEASSDLRRWSSSFLFSVSACSRNSVEVFTHEEASRCK